MKRILFILPYFHHTKKGYNRKKKLALGETILNRTYDVVVLGGGPGGYTAAIRAAQWGKSVAIVEKASVGGTCLHRGCIPSKALLRSAEVYATYKRSEEFGIRVGAPESVILDFERVQQRKNGIVQQLHRGLQSHIKNKKIDILYGTGRLIGPSIFSPQSGAISVETPEGETLTLVNERLIIATGSRPRALPDLTPDGQFILTSDEALELTQLPTTLLIVGGGVIGIEWASMMIDFGIQVTLIETAEQILPAEDAEVAREMTAALKKRGVQILTGVKMIPESIQKIKQQDATPQQIRLELETPTGRIAVEAEQLLLAVGRVPNVEGIGLENTDIVLERGAIRVNPWMQTSESHIYAIGDVTGGIQLAHAASYQGLLAADHLCGQATRTFQHSDVPRCIYSHPEVASIGLTEQAAKAAGLKVKIAKMPFRANGKALVYGEPGGFVKMIADEQTNDIIGVHIIGAHATELISEASLAKLLEATPWELGAAIHPHPTLSEALAEASHFLDGRLSGL